MPTTFNMFCRNSFKHFAKQTFQRHAFNVTTTRACSAFTNVNRQPSFEQRVNTLPELDEKGQIQNDDMPTLVDMRNGKKIMHYFSQNEFENRLRILRAEMARQDVGACLFTSYHNVNYFSGFIYTAFGRPYGLVVTHDDAYTISSGIDGGQPWRRSYGKNICYTDWQRHNFYRAVKQATKSSASAGAMQGKLGVEYDNISVDMLGHLETFFPRRPKFNFSKSAMKQRMVKSEEERKLIRHGARIADLGGAAVVEALDVGVSEYKVAQHATKAMVDEIVRTFPEVEVMDTWTWIQSGINTDGAHNPNTSRKIQKGDIISLNCFPMIYGYYTALERTLFLDHVPDQNRALWQDNLAVHRRGLKLIRPGVKCCDIAAELNEIYEDRGLLEHRSFGYGHSFGTMCHYYGREDDLELREDVETVLRPGMVVSMEPMIMIPENSVLGGAGGYREHDILFVTEDGNENITKFPFGPEHNVIPVKN